MDKVLARIVSTLTSPALILPVAIFALVANADFTQASSALIFLIVGGVPPLLLNVYQYFHESDDEVEPGRSAREAIYLVAVFSFVLDTIIFGSDIMPSGFWANMAMIMAIFFATAYLANKYIDKFSMHVAMYGFTVMLLVGKVNTTLALLFLAIPIIIWARITLQKHTWLQVLLGLAIGLAIGLLAWSL